jgi:hypothetical protein
MPNRDSTKAQVKDTTIDGNIKMRAAQKRASHSIGISSAPIFAQSHFLWGFWLGGKRRGELIYDMPAQNSFRPLNLLNSHRRSKKIKYCIICVCVFVPSPVCAYAKKRVSQPGSAMYAQCCSSRGTGVKFIRPRTNAFAANRSIMPLVTQS